MLEVGVRDLKNGLSGYLRRVVRGERVRVTMRGRPVAELVPTRGKPPEDPELLRLEHEGKLTISRLPKDRNPPPPVRTARGASQYILEEREADR